MHIDSDRDWTDKDTYAKVVIENVKDWGKYKQNIGGTFFETDFGLLYIYLTDSNPLDYGHLDYKYVKVNNLNTRDGQIVLEKIMHPHRKESVWKDFDWKE